MHLEHCMAHHAVLHHTMSSHPATSEGARWLQQFPPLLPSATPKPEFSHWMQVLPMPPWFPFCYSDACIRHTTTSNSTSACLCDHLVTHNRKIWLTSIPCFYAGWPLSPISIVYCLIKPLYSQLFGTGKGKWEGKDTEVREGTSTVTRASTVACAAKLHPEPACASTLQNKST